MIDNRGPVGHKIYVIVTREGSVGRLEASLSQLKLPDHVITRQDEMATVLERGSGRKTYLSLPARPRVRRINTPARYVAALASGVLACYFSYMLMPWIFGAVWEVLALPLVMGLPFLLNRVVGGKVALATYLASFMAIGAMLGALSPGEISLGLVFYGGGSEWTSKYALVPASYLLASLLFGALPFVSFMMVSQVSLIFEVVLPTASGDLVMKIRHPSMVGELLSFLGHLEKDGSRDSSS